MNRSSSSPGLGQWLVVTVMVAAVLFLLFKLYQYGSFRRFYPAGLTIAGVPVGGMTREQAAEQLNARYLAADIIIYHASEAVAVNPTDAEFTLDLETMLSQADFQRQQQDFWAGFWGFLWGRPVEVEQVELSATNNPEALRRVLEQIATVYDKPAQPPQPVPTTLSFQYGETGVITDIDASLPDVQAALYRATDREAHLVLKPVDARRPDIDLLARLIVNHLEDFEGVASIFIMDLESGEEVAINADVAMSGMSIVKVPIALEMFRILDGPLTPEQSRLISETLVVQAGDLSANLLLNIVAGQDDPYLGADIVTESMRRLGLANTFIAVPYEESPRPGRATYETEANSREESPTEPDPAMQTTAEDMGTLLAMIYYCAEQNGGALVAAYRDQVAQEECQQLLEFMKLNHIGSLIEEGVPPDTPVAHRHGWIGDTHGDAGIVFSPAGNYVLVMVMYKDEWLEWEISSPLLADIAQATYNYFNFDAPYLNGTRSN
ncbi:MAG: class A beta-lactamase-related serine hydrolase [Chloroflexi bacterium]|nr:class A beta-lactamase-related serine hydrolase [Chloroflexota bacterium]MCI0576233.1 class A beta-lactamase-related serine hydrolase [Chloroflexota bacterium]MCI0645473.1 class A beta-lactamase-related serine hydrolase [Chloroflexota bacterium]MCI0730612.1 class A beta-lactamase-related serine hydrolase [Chloroflexota bacterium]